MKRFINLLTALLSIAVLSPWAGSAQTPQTQIKVSGLKFEKTQSILSPTTGPGSTDLKFSPKKWMMLEASMKIAAAPMPKSGYIDKLTVTFYLAASNPDKKGQYLKISKEINYINIPVNEEFYVSTYMAPSSVKRLTGSDTIKPNMFEYMGLTVSFNGKEVASISNKGGKMKEWWTVPSRTLVNTDSYPLLSKNETPFSIFWYDRYPEIMPTKESQSTPGSSPTPVAEDAEL